MNAVTSKAARGLGLAAALMTLVAAGCGDLLGPGAQALPTSVDLQAGPAPAIPLARGGEGSIVLEGGFNRCAQEARGEASRRSGRVDLKVTPRGGCFRLGLRPASGYGRYEATISRLDPGQYHLRVIHVYPDQGSWLVHEQEVEVR